MNFLQSQFRLELLTADKANEKLLQDFAASKQGKGLEKFLKESAWTEDRNGATKVYLVKDKKGDIVFFFALSAGLLYQAIEDDDYILSEKEREIVKLCIECQLDDTSTLTPDEVFGWYEDEQETFDKEHLMKIINEKMDVKLEAKQDQSLTDKNVSIMRVAKTFPGIVLTHFCKNQNYSFPEKISFPLGFYVFWEIIVKKVLEISEYLGCQYLYLFAADNTEEASITGATSLYEYIYADVFDEEEGDAPYKLVEYYKNELKFEEVQRLTILKPFYDFHCFSLVQPIAKLLENKEAAWIQHSDIEN